MAHSVSRYNFRLQSGQTTIVFNARTGQLLRLAGGDAATLADILCASDGRVCDGSVPETVGDTLVEGGFLCDPSVDELALVRAQFKRARDETPMVLTVTTSMDCNLGCYYCYETRSADHLQMSHLEGLVAYVRERLTRRPRRSLHVDWYGGEPLINQPFLEAASAALQDLCAELNVTYHASIISNGTLWPADVEAFVARHRIRQVQISFDGLAENHNRRRRYRSGYKPHPEATSFETAWTLVTRLLRHVRVDVRINIDRDNARDLIPFVEQARDAGWFEQLFPAVVQPARLSAYSDKSGFMRRVQLSPEEFDRLRASLRQWVEGTGILVEESEVPDGVPEPKSSVCAALATDSAVIGAEGHLYRCGLQVGETHRAVGSLEHPVAEGRDAEFWADFDPTTRPQCSHCAFLPVCWSGCPKKHLEGDTDAIAEQGLYWRTNLPRLIAKAANVTIGSDFAYSLSEQFRNGYRPPTAANRRIRLRVIGGSCGC